MSARSKLESPKFGLMDRLKKPSPQDPASAEQEDRTDVPEVVEAGDVKVTTYLDADLNRRLQIYVATKKAQKRPGQERVSIKSVLDQAIREFLERQGE